MVTPFGDCPHCRCAYRLKPAYGNFIWACECPPPVTYTTNSTAGIHSAPDANGRAIGRGVQFPSPQPDDTLIGGTHFCGHGMMAAICPTCSLTRPASNSEAK